MIPSGADGELGRVGGFMYWMTSAPSPPYSAGGGGAATCGASEGHVSFLRRERGLGLLLSFISAAPVVLSPRVEMRGIFIKSESLRWVVFRNTGWILRGGSILSGAGRCGAAAPFS